MTIPGTALPDAPPAEPAHGRLPPYSAEDAVCPMCQHDEAFTWFRPALPPNTVQPDWNGQPRRGPLPARLERECGRCTFRWDEALVVDRPGITVEALAYALGQSLPEPLELAPHQLEYAAFHLLKHLRITARPDSPLWRYSTGRPAVCETPHATPEDEDACEQRRLAQATEETR
jgi:hypothetical protein